MWCSPSSHVTMRLNLNTAVRAHVAGHPLMKAITSQRLEHETLKVESPRIRRSTTQVVRPFMPPPVGSRPFSGGPDTIVGLPYAPLTGDTYCPAVPFSFLCLCLDATLPPGTLAPPDVLLFHASYGLCPTSEALCRCGSVDYRRRTRCPVSSIALGHWQLPFSCPPKRELRCSLMVEMISILAASV